MSSRSSKTTTSNNNNNKTSRDNMNEAVVAVAVPPPPRLVLQPPRPADENEPHIPTSDHADNNNNNNSWQQDYPSWTIQHHQQQLFSSSGLRPPRLQRQEHYGPAPSFSIPDEGHATAITTATPPPMTSTGLQQQYQQYQHQQPLYGSTSTTDLLLSESTNSSTSTTTPKMTNASPPPSWKAFFDEVVVVGGGATSAATSTTTTLQELHAMGPPPQTPFLSPGLSPLVGISNNVNSLDCNYNINFDSNQWYHENHHHHHHLASTLAAASPPPAAVLDMMPPLDSYPRQEDTPMIEPTWHSTAMMMMMLKTTPTSADDGNLPCGSAPIFPFSIGYYDSAPPFYYSAGQTQAPITKTKKAGKSPSRASSASQWKDDSSNASDKEAKQRGWTAEESSLLQQAVEIEGTQWMKIARKYFYNERNNKQCKSHWEKNIDPTLKRSAWTKEEDETILRLQEHGKGWPEIADKLPGRNAEQVNDRFSNHIDPTLNKAPLTKEEASMLKEEVEKYTKKIDWVDIVKLFPGRSRDKLKNWWNNSKKLKKRPSGHGDDVNETTKKRRV